MRKQQLSSAAALAFGVVLLGLLPSSDALCCPWVLTQDAKCACADGGLVHPWECCATGGCNVFCCNCAGTCREKGPNPPRGKREALGGSWQELVDETAAYFSSIDLDGDMTIDAEEAETHFRTVRPQDSRTASSSSWMPELDLDGDGRIQPGEFDADIDREDVERAAAAGRF